ncbi:MAG: shikimate dehydrogenase [Isosphaeraceae bacterium]
MICVTIGRGRHKSMLDEWKAAAEAGAELVELRVDCMRSEPDLKRLLSNRYTPVVLTVRRGKDGGLWRGDEEKRQRLLREAIVMGIDYVDLEEDIADKIPRFGKTKRIVSYHNFQKTPANLAELSEKMAAKGADIVKVACLAQSVGDASSVLDIAARAEKPTIGLAMGPLGFFTRILAVKYGAPFTYAGFNPDRIFAPGQPNFFELKREYSLDQVDRDTRVYAVIGDPIEHSLSPAIHNAAFRHHGLNCVYVPLRIPEGQLKDSLSTLAWLDIQGMSVTIPHKEAIVGLLGKAENAVELTGACNTVVVKDQQMVGHNTDYRAAVGSLEAALGGGSGPMGVSPLLDKQALILGAGGAARSFAFGLYRRGAGVTICNRHDERAVKLAEEVGCRSTPWAMRAGTLCDILINCTPVGMHPNVNDSPVPAAAFKPGMVAFDTVYHPEHTMFLKLADDRSCVTISGVDMFVRQAGLQYYLFTGKEPPMELMRQVVRKKLNPSRMVQDEPDDADAEAEAAADRGAAE